MSTNIEKDFEKLQNMGMQNIVNDTHISHYTVQAILEKDFGYFEDETKALRFIKILNSRYDYKLQEWMDEYYAYCEENNIVNQKNENDDMLSIKPSEHYTNLKTNYAPYIFVSMIIIVIIILITILSGDNDDTADAQEENNSTIQTELEQAISKEASINQYKVNDKTLAIIPLSKQEEPETLTQQESIHNELNPEISDLLDSDIVIDLNKSILDIQNNDLTIATNLGRMWIGIIDIDTYDKKSDIVEGTKTFPIYDNTIFITGHGHLTISSGDESHRISSGKKQYFYYKDGSFVKLTRIEYLYINKGIEW